MYIHDIYMHIMCISCVHYVYSTAHIAYVMYRLCGHYVYVTCMLYILCAVRVYYVYIMLSFWFCFCLVYAYTCLPASQLFTLYLSSIHWPTAYVFIWIYLLMRSVVVICSSLGLSIAFYIMFNYCPDKLSKLHNYGDLPAKSLSSAGPDTFAVAYSESLEATI